MVRDSLSENELYLTGQSTVSGTAFPVTIGFAGSYAPGTPTIGSDKIWLIQAGSSATGAGSNVTVVYSQKFGEVPIVNCTHMETLEAILPSSVGAGSFVCATTSASQNFNWIAIGKA